MDHYNDRYFGWQRNIGAFGGFANVFKFREYVGADANVLDFGCGGGYLVANLSCRERLGIEPIAAARAVAAQQGIRAVATIEEVPDEFADLVISNHALEHVEAPLEVLRALQRVVKGGGLLVFVVPHESPRAPFREDDVNQHLYTWNRLTLGNLFKRAGYEIIRVETIRHAWPPGYLAIRRMLGATAFDAICWLTALVLRNYQVRVVARKRLDNRG